MLVARVLSALRSAFYRLVRPSDRGRRLDAEARRSETTRACSDSLQSEQALDALFQNALDSLVMVTVHDDGSFSYESVNPAEQTALGLDSAAMIGKSPADCLPLAAAEEVLATWRKCVQERRPGRYALTMVLPDRAFASEGFVAPVFDETGRVCRLIGSARDVTERNRSTHQLSQSHKLEAVGQLAAGVAQDFNNLLQAILSAVDLLGEQVGEDERAQQAVAIARKAAYRGASLTHRLLTVSRQQALNPALLDLRESLSEMVEVFTPVLGHHIQIEQEIEPRLWPIMADAQGLETCLMNLAVNARDAMAGGGMLRIHLRNGRASEPGAPALTPGEYVVIGVEDTGTGMNPGTLARACDPFFTTKAPGKGSGLGLPMVDGFAAQSGGAMHLQSIAGQGTRVDVWLPRASGARPVADSANQAEALACRGRVLLVDDDPDVREVLQILLTDAGYAVIPVDNGEMALEWVQGGIGFDILISDYAMPGMTGAELVTHVLHIRPNMPALIITGFSAVGPSDRLPSGVRLLRKPLRRQELFSQVEAALSHAPASIEHAPASTETGMASNDRSGSNVVPFEGKNLNTSNLRRV